MLGGCWVEWSLAGGDVHDDEAESCDGAGFVDFTINSDDDMVNGDGSSLEGTNISVQVRHIDLVSS